MSIMTYPLSTSQASDPVRRMLASLVVLCLGVLFLTALGVLFTRQFGHLYLVWNLVLALAPLVFALAIRWFEAQGRMSLVIAGLVPWLLFLPNSPYVLTDFMHLTETPQAWFWGHLVVLVWCSFTALFAGLVSLRLLHDIVERRFGGLGAWSFVCIVSLLTGVGVALGRFQRWNSWDAIRQPGEIAFDVLRQLPLTSRPSVETLFPWAFGAFFGAAYLMVWSMTPWPKESRAVLAAQQRTSLRVSS